MPDKRKRIGRASTKPAPLDPVTSIGNLLTRATTDTRYRQLAMISASNLGGVCKDLPEAIQWLYCNANDGPMGEQGVVDEINFCRDLVK